MRIHFFYFCGEVCERIPAADVASKLGNKGINIEYCYGALSKKGNATAVILDVSDIDRALKILK